MGCLWQLQSKLWCRATISISNCISTTSLQWKRVSCPSRNYTCHAVPQKDDETTYCSLCCCRTARLVVKLTVAVNSTVLAVLVLVKQATFSIPTRKHVGLVRVGLLQSSIVLAVQRMDRRATTRHFLAVATPTSRPVTSNVQRATKSGMGRRRSSAYRQGRGLRTAQLTVEGRMSLQQK